MSGNIEKYNERLKVDMNITQKLTDDQLNTRLLQGLSRLEQLGHKVLLPEPAVDAEFETYGEIGQDEVVGDNRGPVTSNPTQSNSDLV